MKFIIHFTYKNGTEDSIGVEGENIEQIRDKAKKETESRGVDWDDPQANFWSEEVQ